MNLIVLGNSKKQRKEKGGSQFISTGVKRVIISDAPYQINGASMLQETAALSFWVQVHVTLRQLLNRQQQKYQHRE